MVLALKIIGETIDSLRKEKDMTQNELDEKMKAYHKEYYQKNRERLVLEERERKAKKKLKNSKKDKYKS